MANIFKKSDLSKFTKALTKGVNAVKEDVIRGLQEAEYIINLDSQAMMPYDSGDAYNSWFSKIEVGDKTITLVAGYDESGQLDYLPLIHELGGPIGNEYGWKALEDQGVQYTSEGYKIAPQRPSSSLLPQSHFLKKAMENNFPDIMKNNLKVTFGK